MASFTKPLRRAIRKDKTVLQQNATNYDYLMEWFNRFDTEQEWGIQLYEKALQKIGVEFKYHN